MNCKIAAASSIALSVIVVLSLFLVLNWVGETQIASREFYVGVEFAYGNETSQVKQLVDEVKGYTNLFVLGSLSFLDNQTALTEACDYIDAAKLNFIVLFTGLDKYSYNITEWMLAAQTRYGDRFLGIDRYDEPGGNQIDDGAAQLIKSDLISSNATYKDVSKAFVGNLSVFPAYYLQFSPGVFTADYALYWFDYQAGYTSIFAEFVGNESRERHIALCRGAADAFGKDWGVVVTWKYNQAPYLESGDELYNDLVLAYSAGAKYVVVFSYPNITEYGTLSAEHFDALERFWITLHTDPASLGSNIAEVAYVVPADYGFSFRSVDDSIWGLFPADDLSAKIYGDVEVLTARYGVHLNILYDSPQAAAQLASYRAVFYWNQTIS
ncbi:MAG: hypothetical protein ACQCN4_03035 [Candidatus Bathyarchaeia archaeon]